VLASIDRRFWLDIVLALMALTVALWLPSASRWILGLISIRLFWFEGKKKYLELKAKFLEWYHKTWPGNDKVVLLQRLWPYSKYVTVYDKILWVKLFGECWNGVYFSAYAKRFWRWGTTRHKPFPNLWRDYKKVKSLLPRPPARFEKMRSVYERLS
jgi:hypothetical protein